MKKINWNQVRESMEYVCFGMACCLDVVIIAVYDNKAIVRNIALGGMAITFIIIMLHG